jgi:hypothetical protein
MKASEAADTIIGGRANDSIFTKSTSPAYPRINFADKKSFHLKFRLLLFSSSILFYLLIL